MLKYFFRFTFYFFCMMNTLSTFPPPVLSIRQIHAHQMLVCTWLWKAQWGSRRGMLWGVSWSLSSGLVDPSALTETAAADAAAKAPKADNSSISDVNKDICLDYTPPASSAQGQDWATKANIKKEDDKLFICLRSAVRLRDEFLYIYISHHQKAKAVDDFTWLFTFIFKSLSNDKIGCIHIIWTVNWGLLRYFLSHEILTLILWLTV